MSKTYGDKPLVFAFDGDGEEYMIGSEVHSCLQDFCSTSKNSPLVSCSGGQLLAPFPWSPVQEVPWLGQKELDQRWEAQAHRHGSLSGWSSPPRHCNDSNVKNCYVSFAARHLLDNISTAGKGGWGPACWKVNSWLQASFKAFGWKSNLKTILKLSHRDDQFKGNAGNSDTPKLDKPKVTRSFNCEYYESFNPC